MNISTYKGLLLTIQRFEEEQDKFRKKRFLWCTILFIISTAIFLCYATYKSSIDIFISTDLIGTVLIPVFTYLFASYEKDQIDLRRAEIISMIVKNFNDDNIDLPSFGDGPIKFDDLKSIIYNLLNSKL